MVRFPKPGPQPAKPKLASPPSATPTTAFAPGQEASKVPHDPVTGEVKIPRPVIEELLEAIKDVEAKAAATREARAAEREARDHHWEVQSRAMGHAMGFRHPEAP